MILTNLNFLIIYLYYIILGFVLAARQGLETYSFSTGCQYFLSLTQKILGNLVKQFPKLFYPLTLDQNQVSYLNKRA